VLTQQTLLGTAGAIFSTDKKYRYSLWRDLGGDGQVCFIMLNPSTADADVDDPTIRRCIGFTKSWGYGRLVVVNLFGYRSTDPKPIRKYGDAVTGDPHNIGAIVEAATGSKLIVAAWGANAFPNRERPAYVARRITEAGGRALHCLRTTAAGHPNHPLYLPADLTPIPFTLPHGQ
jgi:hypothetical protein